MELDVTGVEIEVNRRSDNGQGESALLVRCDEDGFCFILECPDGVSSATSQLFTWKQIAQLLIAADPDMFAILDEPLHQVFPQTLESLGYYVPNW